MELLSDNIESLLTLLVLAAVHIGAGTTALLRHQWQPRALSASAGISVAYVFLDLMPALAARQDLIDDSGLFSVGARHVYLVALVGLTVAFGVETASRHSRRRRRQAGEPDRTGTGTFWLSIISFVVFNAAIGYAVARPGDEAVRPFWMFALAMGLHFLANDHALVEHHGDRYRHIGRWLLVGGLLIGWVIGVSRLEVRAEGLALVLAYIAGGSIMNILRHELPDTDRPTDLVAFAAGAAAYGIAMLSLAPPP